MKRAPQSPSRASPRAKPVKRRGAPETGHLDEGRREHDRALAVAANGVRVSLAFSLGLPPLFELPRHARPAEEVRRAEHEEALQIVLANGGARSRARSRRRAPPASARTALRSRSESAAARSRRATRRDRPPTLERAADRRPRPETGGTPRQPREAVTGDARPNGTPRTAQRPARDRSRQGGRARRRTTRPFRPARSASARAGTPPARTNTIEATAGSSRTVNSRPAPTSLAGESPNVPSSHASGRRQRAFDRREPHQAEKHARQQQPHGLSFSLPWFLLESLDA